MKALMMEYMMAPLIHKILKWKEKELQGENVAMLLHQNKICDPHPQQDARICFNYHKLG